MKFVVATLVLMLLLVPPAFSQDQEDDLSDYSLLKSVENSQIVAIGRVVLLTGKWRSGILPNGGGAICTDVMVRVETMIKGKPNSGKKHIKFIVQGGTAYIPSEDEVSSLWVSTQATFEVGERIMVLLTNNRTQPYYANYPYDRHRLIYTKYGKRPIENNEVKFLYEKNNGLKTMHLPVELATDLAKAYLKDKSSALSIENQIKSIARTDENRLSTAITNQIKTSSKTIIDREELK